MSMHVCARMCHDEVAEHVRHTLHLEACLPPITTATDAPPCVPAPCMHMGTEMPDHRVEDNTFHHKSALQLRSPGQALKSKPRLSVAAVPATLLEEVIASNV